MITNHALQRAKERTGFNTEDSERLIISAINRVGNAGVFDVKEREYLKRREDQEGCRTVVHKKYCFIIADGDVCVTMYNLPSWFKLKKSKPRKQKIKNVRMYLQNIRQSELENDLLEYLKVDNYERCLVS